MLYQFKTQPEDFIVEEILPFIPSGEGDFLYIFFEKKNQNTMDVVLTICKKSGLQRKMIGIAGLKDKNAITRQWMCVGKNSLETKGGVEKFLDIVKNEVTILDTTRHPEPIKIGQNAGNNFQIRLRAKKNISQDIKDQLKQNIQSIQAGGIPNVFGQQRFGKGDRNFVRAKKVIELGHVIEGDFEIKFKLQAYASMYFNTYAMQRWNQDKKLLEGDLVLNRYHGFDAKVGVYQNGKVHIFDHKKLKFENENKDILYPDMFTEVVDFDENIRIPTGPMLGANAILPPVQTPSREEERAFISPTKFFITGVEVCRHNMIYGIRRPLWVKPKNLEYSFDGDDLLISFGLPTGSYATVILGRIFKDIDEKTCKDNKLLIPKIESI